jgi:hypothetical protein
VLASDVGTGSLETMRSSGRTFESSRARFDAFDLRIAQDTTGDRLSTSAKLTETVASMLPTGLFAPRTGPVRNDMEPSSQRELRGWDSNPQPLG